MNEKTIIDLLSEVIENTEGILFGAIMSGVVFTFITLVAIGIVNHVPETEVNGCLTVNENNKIYLEVSAPCLKVMQELAK